MTTVLPQSAQVQQDAPACASLSSFPDLSSLSTLWVPLHEVRQQWAAFGQEALTTSALIATSTAFGGLYWETHALQHCTWAVQERECERWHQTVFWLSRAVQDLDCALDQWQQVQRMLNLAGNDRRQQDPESLQTIRTLMAQVRVAAVPYTSRYLERTSKRGSTSSSSGNSRAASRGLTLRLRNKRRRCSDGHHQGTDRPAYPF